MSKELGSESRFATAIAAAAFAIHSLENANRINNENLKASRAKGNNKSRRVEIATETTPSSTRILARLFSSKDATNSGEATSKYSIGIKREEKLATPKHKSSEEQFKMRSGIGSKADDWENDQMIKTLERYEKMKSAILDWENQKKLQAKLKMEKRKSLLELRRTRNMQHYQSKIARIEMIAGGARSQLEEKRKNNEFTVKDKAKLLRSRQNVGVKYCFCFTC